jgi:ribonuclease P protein component
VKLRPHFQLAQSRGRKVHTPHFVVCVLTRQVGAARTWDGARLGVTVTRKIAGAVGRNRVKRVVREVFRCNRSQFPSGSDVVVIAKSGAPALSFADAETELLGALRRRRT